MLTSQLVQQAIEDDSGDKFSIPFPFYASSLNNIDRLLGERIVCSGICVTRYIKLLYFEAYIDCNVTKTKGK